MRVARDAIAVRDGRAWSAKVAAFAADNGAGMALLTTTRTNTAVDAMGLFSGSGTAGTNRSAWAGERLLDSAIEMEARRLAKAQRISTREVSRALEAAAAAEAVERATSDGVHRAAKRVQAAAAAASARGAAAQTANDVAAERSFAAAASCTLRQRARADALALRLAATEEKREATAIAASIAHVAAAHKQAAMKAARRATAIASMHTADLRDHDERAARQAAAEASVTLRLASSARAALLKREETHLAAEARRDAAERAARKDEFRRCAILGAVAARDARVAALEQQRAALVDQRRRVAASAGEHRAAVHATANLPVAQRSQALAALLQSL